eukprot:TRINITY_DN17354_c0_g1_i1.p1 TRINITY_DN17354_c0_g1~~TRINITY_DN17354_c0_g1_i1.p1  ORF type:complete len:229 (+),score=61.06 TRINITY_DN17354_c0_g1_i1:106-792(+)
MVKKTKKKLTLYDKIQARRDRYDGAKLDQAIQELFAAVDEDGSGFLEAHEFVIAQAAVAELAGDDFEEAVADQAFKDIKPFDSDGDSRISLKEFVKKFQELCEVIPCRKDELINSMADAAARANTASRRELAREIRQYFDVLDTDGDRFLGAAELAQLEEILNSLAEQGSAATGAELVANLDIRSLDKDNNGKVDSQEFVDAFAAKMKLMKVPKTELVQRLRQLREDA